MIPVARQCPTFDVTAPTSRFWGSMASAKNRSSATHQSRLKRSFRSVTRVDDPGGEAMPDVRRHRADEPLLGIHGQREEPLLRYPPVAIEALLQIGDPRR